MRGRRALRSSSFWPSTLTRPSALQPSPHPSRCGPKSSCSLGNCGGSEAASWTSPTRTTTSWQTPFENLVSQRQAVEHLRRYMALAGDGGEELVPWVRKHWPGLELCRLEWWPAGCRCRKSHHWTLNPEYALLFGSRRSWKINASPGSCTVVRCAMDSLYTGIARDVNARVAQHNQGRGRRATREAAASGGVACRARAIPGFGLAARGSIKALPRKASCVASGRLRGRADAVTPRRRSANRALFDVVLHSFILATHRNPKVAVAM